jgi:hypothetical protein
MVLFLFLLLFDVLLLICALFPFIVIEEVIIIIKRIEVVEIFKKEDVEDINLRAGLIYIN